MLCHEWQIMMCLDATISHMQVTQINLSWFRAYVDYNNDSPLTMTHPFLISEQEAGFSLERIVGISEIITDVKAYNVCTTTLDTAEFHTMVKVGKFQR